MTTLRMLSLKALDTFKCIGPECPATCCAVAWQIEVSKPIIEKWDALPEGQTKTNLLASLRSYVPPFGLPENPDMRAIEMGIHSRCPHLTATGWCSIHSELGPDHLPLICQRYPRKARRNPALLLNTGELSCPELLRMVMFNQEKNKNPFRDECKEGETTETVMHHAICRIFHRLIEQEQYSINTRLYGIATLLVDLANLGRLGKLDASSLDRSYAALASFLDTLSSRISSQKIARNPIVSGSFWHAMYHFAHNRGLFDQFPGCPGDEIKALFNNPRPSEKDFLAIEAMVSHLRESAQATLHQAEYQTAFECYVRAALISKGFPDFPFVGNYIATFLNCFIPFAIAQLILWMINARHGDLGQNDVLKAVYLTERTLGQSTDLYKYLNEHTNLLALNQYLEVFSDSF